MSKGNIEFTLALDCYCHACGSEFVLRDFPADRNIICPYCGKKSNKTWNDTLKGELKQFKQVFGK